MRRWGTAAGMLLAWALLTAQTGGCNVAWHPAVDPYSLQQQGLALVTVASRLQTQTADAFVAQALDREATKAAQAGQATGTAQVQILAAEGTLTAVAIGQTQTAGEATRQADELALLATAGQGTRFVEETDAAATPTAEAILLAAQVDQEKAAQAKIMRWVWAVVLVILTLTAFGIAGWIVYVIMNIRRKTNSRFSPDDVLVLDGKQDYNVVFPARLTASLARLEAGKDPRTIEPEDPGYQERHNARDQALRALNSAAHNPAILREVVTQIARLAGTDIPALPEGGATMEALAGWQIGQGLPLGVGAQGLVLANPETSPHFLFAGTTGSGKTRSGLRPLIAAALAGGWQAVIFDPSGLDFLPFKDHPNAKLVTLADASETIGYLQALFQLIRERLKLLASAEVSTWSRLPNAGPEILCVFDEFSNLADSLDNKGREELWRWARMIAAEGRKAGVHLALALQDPTHKSLDLRIRRNMTGVAFRVRDQAASRVILNVDGAETLPPKHFLAGLGLELVRGVGFAPGDDGLRTWLAQRPEAKLPEPEWLKTTTNNPNGEPNAPAGAGVQETIVKLAAEGWPATTICERVFGYKNGEKMRLVRRVIDTWLADDDDEVWADEEVTGDESDEVTGDEGSSP